MGSGHGYNCRESLPYPLSRCTHRSGQDRITMFLHNHVANPHSQLIDSQLAHDPFLHSRSVDNQTILLRHPVQDRAEESHESHDCPPRRRHYDHHHFRVLLDPCSFSSPFASSGKDPLLRTPAM